MPCYYPVSCSVSKFEKVVKTGKGFFRYGHKVPDSANFESVQVPCTRCIGCRLERSRQDAVRSVHEASCFDDNCFITLTYSDDFVPKSGSLVKSDFQLFMKRLREFVYRSAPAGADGQAKRVRFLACGEYGGNLGRPHYHALLFGYDFPDRVFFTVQNGFNLYRSAILERLWPFGFSLIGDVSFESAAYVSRYILKKVTGENADGYYDGRVPEFTLRSLKPGIGATWLDRYKKSVYPDDFIVLDGGVKCKPPKYYDVRLNLTDPDLLCKMKEARKNFALRSKDNSPDRLEVRRRVKLAQLRTLKRRLD